MCIVGNIAATILDVVEVYKLVGVLQTLERLGAAEYFAEV
jgi:hypothetical protein